MIRVVAVLACGFALGCPSTDGAEVASQPSGASAAKARVDAVAADVVAASDGVQAAEIVAPATIPMEDEPSRAVAAIEAPKTAVTAEPTVVTTIRWDESDGLHLAGFPAVSMDGMHLAFVEREGARVAVQVRRLDGEVLVDKVLVEASEGEAGARLRRVRARAMNAQKVLAQAGMRGLEARADVLVARDGQMVARVQGFADLKIDQGVLAKCGAAAIEGTFVDTEHGLVVVELAGRADCANDETHHDWQVLTLTALP